MYLSLLIISITALFILLFFMKNKVQKTQLKIIFVLLLWCFIIWCSGLIAQILFSERTGIPPIYFDYIVYVAGAFFPTLMLLMSLVFTYTKINFTRKYLCLLVIPIISLLVLWTNDFHNLFYVEYSINIDDTIFGAYGIFFTVYTYLLLIAAIVIFLKHSIKNAGFFSRQSLLIVIGFLIPIGANIIFLFNLFDTNPTIYTTPITFVGMAICHLFAIFKLQFLNVLPIALQKVVDQISDGFILVNEDGKMVDYNKTLIEMLRIDNIALRSKSINELYNSLLANGNINVEAISKAISKAKHDNERISIENYFEKIDTHYNIEISSIFQKESYIATLILFKDITAHVKSREIMARQAEKQAFTEEARNIAHEIKSPLAGIKRKCF